MLFFGGGTGQGLTILLCSSGYPGTCYVDQAGTYRDLPAFDSQVLGLKVCIAMTSHTQIFMWGIWIQVLMLSEQVLYLVNLGVCTNYCLLVIKHHDQEQFTGDGTMAQVKKSWSFSELDFSSHHSDGSSQLVISSVPRDPNPLLAEYRTYI